MNTSAIDREMFTYFMQLNDAEKKSVVEMIKTFLKRSNSNEDEDIDIDEYNKEIEEAMARIDAGEFYTHEEVVEMSKKWLHDK